MERISVFDMFKIGVGPSSSHTLGPWRAAQLFLKKIQEKHPILQIKQVQIWLYGSLAKTGKGHGTDVAILLGLCGYDPETIDVAQINDKINNIYTKKQLLLNGFHAINFEPIHDLAFLIDASLPFHPNAMTLGATFQNGDALAETYYSIGGGFVIQEHQTNNEAQKTVSLPYPIDCAEDLINHCLQNAMSISEVVWENEQVWRKPSQIRRDLLHIWHTMRDCIYRGCHTQGELPGGLQVLRRAFGLNKGLLDNAIYLNYDEWLQHIQQNQSFSAILDWINCFALAVNEENASFGRVVTAPTNGAAGVIPAVLQYMIAFTDDNNNDEKIIQFLLTAGELGSIFKKGATISAAMGGCQAEIGVSSAMAAGALAECLGGSLRQVIMATEIAMEHHLGLTCDPVAGLVQIPCIERNAMGAIKAITACQLALASDPQYARVSLDEVIKTMWETALDMNSKYKETADGGLAVNVPLGLSEC